MEGGNEMEQLSKVKWPQYVERPVKVLQFGEGNFLRAFVDWQIDELNNKTDFNGQVVVVQPRGQGKMARVNKQDGLFTLLLQGLKDGKAVEERQVVNAISHGIELVEDYDSYLQLAHEPSLRFVVSNTTEAGIVFDETDRLLDCPAKSFPAKLTAFLYERFLAFNSAANKGLVILPCELIEKNGEQLKMHVLNYAKHWQLSSDFSEWIETANTFCNTLVDRIVPGQPANATEVTQQLGYKDELLVAAEHYYFWAIEGPASLKEELPFTEAGLQTIFVDDLAPYRTRKVRILNGAHTAMTPVGYLYGLQTVSETIEHDVVGAFIKEMIFDEIVPVIEGNRAEIEAFADDVLARFKNPYIEHYLMSIAMNSISKFKTRNVPTLLTYYERNGTVPNKLAFSLAALFIFYRGQYEQETIALADDAAILACFNKEWACYTRTRESAQTLVTNLLRDELLWGVDLTQLEGLVSQVSDRLYDIERNGIKQALQAVVTMNK